MTKLAGKVVAVTGAASGIGRALAEVLHERGAEVAMSDINEAGLLETAALLRSNVRCSTQVVDVRDPQAVEAWAAQVVADHGGVDVIINNAGLAARGSIADMPYDDFKLVLDVDMWGVVHGVRAFMPHLHARGAGHIVNIASINAMVPFALNGPYNMAKYAVLGLSETLMQELHGTAIHVTSVHPGGIRTNIVRNARHMGDGDATHFDRIARTSPRSAATTILNGVERNRRRVYVGLDAKLMATVKRIAPAVAVHLAGVLSSQSAKRYGLPSEG